MEIAIVLVFAFGAAFLTFFSGFGLGTLLTPVLAVILPLEYAIGITAIVHLLNNLFKISLVHKNINWPVAVKFGLYSAAGALIGAYILVNLNFNKVLYSIPTGIYGFMDEIYLTIELYKVILGSIMLVFVAYEAIPRFSNYKFPDKALWIGGIISGFFGGLTGNQGALRSSFLIKTNLTKEGYVATGAVIACFVDITRLSLYKNILLFNKQLSTEHTIGVLLIIVAAFAGTYIGNKYLQKTTHGFVKTITAIMLTCIAIGLIIGII